MRSTVGDYLGLLEVPEGEPRRAAWVDRYEPLTLPSLRGITRTGAIPAAETRQPTR